MFYKLICVLIGLTCAAPSFGAAPTFTVPQGGTGSSTLTGILLGNGVSSIQTLKIGTNLTLSSGTLSASLSGGAASSTLLSDNNTFSGTNVFSIGKLVIGDWTLSTSTVVCAAGCEFTSIQSALDAGWKHIQLKAETYTLSASTTISASNVFIEGEGDGTVLSFNGASVNPAIAVGDGLPHQFLHFANLKFNQTNATQQGVAIDAAGMQLSKFENVQFAGVGTCIKFASSTSLYNVVQNPRCQIATTNPKGFIFDNGANENAIYNARIQTDSNSTGVYVNAHAIKLYNVDVETGAAVGIDIGASGHDALISSPYLEGNTIGVRIASGAEATTIEGGFITDNTSNITDNGARGLSVHNVRIQNDPANYYLPGTLYTGLGSSTPNSYYVIQSPTTNDSLLSLVESSSGLAPYIQLISTGAFSGSQPAIQWKNYAGGLTTAQIASTNGASFTNSNLTFSVADASKTLQTRLTINNAGNLNFGSASSTDISASNSLFWNAASGTSLRVSNLKNCDTIDTDATGLLSCGTDATGAGGSGGDPFTHSSPTISATSTRIDFTGGLLSLASTTIGDGTQTGGLTIYGNATTTIAGSASLPSRFSIMNTGSQAGQVSELCLGGYQGNFKNCITSTLNAGGASSDLTFKYGNKAESTAMTISGVTGSLKLTDSLFTGRQPSYKTLRFTYASSSQGTGTTTRFLGPSAENLTFQKALCNSDSFIGVSLYDGTNRTNYIIASSTVGTTTFSTNNTFVGGESIRVDIGTSTAGANVHLGCTFLYTYD